VVQISPLFLSVSGDANFQMHQTALTVGGFTQPVVAKSLIELPSSAEKGFAQRFLWILPQPKFSTFESLQLVDDSFTRYLGNNHIELQSPVQAFLHSSLSCIFFVVVTK
jgi:hypothetical protein